MARPITWQDVAAPNQAGNLAAAVAASEQVSRALIGLGNVASNVRAVQQAEATKAAVADIMSSNDPATVAAAAPRGWEVDPLAVAQAAQERTGVLRQEKVQDAQLAASGAATAASQAATAREQEILEDIKATREAEEIAQRSWEATAKAGVATLSEEDRARGQASIKAGAILDQRLNTMRDNARADAQLALQKSQAQMTQTDRAFQDQFAGFLQSPQGQMMEPTQQLQYGAALAKRLGANRALVNQIHASIAPGAAQFTPTTDQLGLPATTIKTKDADGKATDVPITYREAAGNLAAQKDALDRQIAAKTDETLAKYGGPTAFAPSPYDGMDEATLAAALVALPKEQWGFDLEDTKDRIRHQVAAAKKPYTIIDENGKKVTRERSERALTSGQLAQLVLSTRDSGILPQFLTLDALQTNGGGADAKRIQFLELNRAGGAAGVQKQLQAELAPWAKEQATIARGLTEVNAAARGGGSLSPTVQKQIEKPFRKVEEEQAARRAQDVLDRQEAQRRQQIQEDIAAVFVAGAFNY